MQRRVFLATPALLSIASKARAQAWPNRQPIRLIAGFPAGGLADAIGRLFAAPLSDALGNSVVVENRAGASGTIGADAVAKAAPDGLTLAELGAPQATQTQWIGLSGPRGLPAPIVERLSEALAPIARSEPVQARLVEYASVPRSPTPSGAAFTRFVASFRDHWVAMAKAEGIAAS
jgi:tripartite-type tricarboxylate transporter receptor subunit TctC